MSSYTQDRIEAEASDIAIIASGQKVSSPVRSLGGVLVGIITPSVLSGANFTFEVSTEETGVYKTYYNSAGSIVQVAVGADRHIGQLPADFAGTEFIKVVSDTSEAAERSIQLVFRGM